LNEKEARVSSPVLQNYPVAQDHPYMEVFSEIGAIEYHIRSAVTRHLPPGMTYAHFELLRHFIRHGDGQTPAELANILLMTKGAVTNVLQKMTAQGFVCVLADVSDGRKKRVKITRAGVEAANCVFRNMKAKTEALRSGFTDNEFRDAVPFLKALRTFLSEVNELDGLAVETR
jgi:DNA-binding MarR family transcriptional regulator